MVFLSIFRKSQNVSVIPLNGIIAPNMGRRKGLNLNEIDKNMDDIEERKLSELGKTRWHYESLVDELEKNVSEIN